MRIGRIKVIFNLPLHVLEEYSGREIPTNLPQESLAYIEWYTKLQSAAEKNYLMYKISKPPIQADGNISSEIIHLLLYDRAVSFFPNLISIEPWKKKHGQQEKC